MYLFMIFLLPLILAAYCIYKKDKRIVPVIFVGLIAAVLVCGFKAFFLYSHRIVPFSFGKNVIFLLVRQTLLPVLLVYGIFFVWSKDELSFKIEAFYPLVMSFYALYLPYTIISTSDHVITSFQLFVKPAGFAVMFFSLSIIMRRLEVFISEKKYAFIGIFGALALIYLIIPALLESMYILDVNYFLVLLLSAVYCLLAPLAKFYFLIDQKKKLQ